LLALCAACGGDVSTTRSTTPDPEDPPAETVLAFGPSANGRLAESLSEGSTGGDALLRFDVRYDAEGLPPRWVRVGVVVSGGRALLAQLEPLVVRDPPATSLSEVPLVDAALREALTELAVISDAPEASGPVFEAARAAWVDRREETEAHVVGRTPASVAEVWLGLSGADIRLISDEDGLSPAPDD